MGPAQFLIGQEQAQARQHIARILQKSILPAEQAFQKRQGLFPIAPQKFIHKGEEILFHRPGKEVLQIGHIDGFPAVGHGDAQFLQLRKDIEQRNIAPGLEQGPQIGHGPAGQALALPFQIVRHIRHDRLFRHRFGSHDVGHGLQGLEKSTARIHLALAIKQKAVLVAEPPGLVQEPLLILGELAPRPAAALERQKGTVIPNRDRPTAKETRPLEGFDDRRRHSILLERLNLGFPAGPLVGSRQEPLPTLFHDIRFCPINNHYMFLIFHDCSSLNVEMRHCPRQRYRRTWPSRDGEKQGTP